MKWTFWTPASRASRAEVIFGIMPPEMVPSFMRFLASEPVTDSMRVFSSFGSRRRPGTSERYTSLAGLRVQARAAAARSALML